MKWILIPVPFDAVPFNWGEDKKCPPAFKNIWNVLGKCPQGRIKQSRGHQCLSLSICMYKTHSNLNAEVISVRSGMLTRIALQKTWQKAYNCPIKNAKNINSAISRHGFPHCYQSCILYSSCLTISSISIIMYNVNITISRSNGPSKHQNYEILLPQCNSCSLRTDRPIQVLSLPFYPSLWSSL